MATIFGTGADELFAAGTVGGAYTLSNFESDLAFGGAGADSIIGVAGNVAPSQYFGQDGNDSIQGSGGGNSFLNGEAGDDTIVAGSGFNQLLFGGLGNDSIVGGSGNTYADGGNDADTIIGGAGFDRLFGTQGADLLSGGGGGDLLDGGTEADTLEGQDGNDSVDGGSGNDSITGGNDNDRLDGGDGNNTVLGEAGSDSIYAGFNNDSLSGGGGSDVIMAGDGLNTIDGGADNDRIYAGGGADSIIGGDGGDLIDANNGNNTVDGGAGDDRIFGGVDNDSIIGGLNDTTDGGEFIDAHRGNNTVMAGFGDDRVIASFGNDSLMGQDGNDALLASDGNNTVLGGAGNDNISAGVGADSIEGEDGSDTIVAGGGNDTITGGAGGDDIDAGNGNDRVDGGSGSDLIRLGGNNDTVIASTGNDLIDGGDGFDTADYSLLGPNTRIFVDQLFGFARVVKRDAAGLIGVETVTGVENYIGTAGDDRFTGWGIDETFTGGAGNDYFDGGDGFDAVRFDVAGVGNVSVNLMTGIAQDGLGGTDRFRKVSAGNSSVETIITGLGADTVVGDDDNNTIRGGAGADSLVGGAGSDLADWNGDSSVTGVLANMGSVVVDGVAGGTARDSSGSIDTISGFEALRGTDAADTLIGDDAANGLRGARGADLLRGGLGFDTADYRNDSDGVPGANVTLPGGSGDGFGAIVNLSDAVVLVGSFGAESVASIGARTGRDGWGDLDTLESIEAARGTNLHDLLIGTQRAPVLVIGDVAFFAEDRSFLHGRVGNDTIRAIEADDGVVASYSDDITGIVARLDLGNLVIDGFGTTDTLVNVRAIQGSDHDDLIRAGNSGSWMRGRAGNDTLIGGDGFDVLNYNSAAGAVMVNLITGTAQDGDGGTDSLGGVDTMGAYDASTAFDFISGGAGADTLIGHGDGMLFFGGAGADTIVGGAGEDGISYYGAWVGVTTPIHQGVNVNLTTGVARDGDGSSPTGSLDRFSSIEHAVGTHTADTLVGAAGANTLAGMEGGDSLNGQAGNDVLLGGLGNDLADGGADADSIDGGLGNDQLLGGLGNDQLLGGDGADTLDGGIGNDTTDGGAGDDLHLVSSRFDVVAEGAAGGADTLSSSVTYTLGAGVEVELFVLSGASTIGGTGNALDNTMLGNAGGNTLDGGAGNDSLDGAGGADWLLGGLGNDLLAGGGGADTLFGGFGADTLTGDADADIFYFDRAVDSYRGLIDSVTDMEIGVDRIGLENTASRLFAGLTPTAISFNGVVSVASANLSTGNNTYLNVLNGFTTALGGGPSVTASTATLQAWQIDVAGGTAAGRYVFVNDASAGASANDLLVGVTLVGGAALSASDFVLM